MPLFWTRLTHKAVDEGNSMKYLIWNILCFHKDLTYICHSFLPTHMIIYEHI